MSGGEWTLICVAVAYAILGAVLGPLWLLMKRAEGKD